MLKKNKLIFLGAPGAGKGTFAGLLKEEYPIAHISTGDILRGEIEQGSKLGSEAVGLMEKGQLVPDEIVADMVKKRLACSDCLLGFILDGFPRNVNQAKLLEHAIHEIDSRLDAVIYFKVPDDLILQRLTARISCKNCGSIYSKLFSPPQQENICDKCGSELIQRPDDSPDTAKQRLKVFYENTKPLIDFYAEQGLLITILETDKLTAFALLKKELK